MKQSLRPLSVVSCCLATCLAFICVQYEVMEVYSFSAASSTTIRQTTPQSSLRWGSVPVVGTTTTTTTTTRTIIVDNKTNMDHTTLIEGRGSTTIDAPTRERVDRKTGKRNDRQDDDEDDDDDDEDDDYNDMEYLMDPNALRGMNDPFHILLLGSTFEKPKVTVPYVTNSLEYVLSMPSIEAKELSQFAKDEGMSCLGTWPREKCLKLGKQLQVRDIVCRVVPYCEGGQRSWQAKDSFSSSSSSGGGTSSSSD